jgi:hypothetical protein
MSATAATASVATPTIEDELQVEVQDELHRRVVRAMATGEAFADIPNGCELWLLPDDDAAHVAWVLRAATEAVIPGRNLYLRWVQPGDLPPLSPDQERSEAIRRVAYRADGSADRVWVPDGNGWREVEPTPEDRAGLPPVGSG